MSPNPRFVPTLRPSWLGALISLILILITAGLLNAQEPGLLRVGGDIDYRPYSYVSPDGEATGFDIELMELLAARLGLQTEYTLDSWSTVLRELEEQRVDVLVGTLFTISRTENFIFTEPYNTDTISIFVRDDSSIDALRELEGKTAAVMEGDAIPETVLNTNGIRSRTNSFPTMTAALLSVSAGASHYALVPYAVGMETLDQAAIDNVGVAGPAVYTIQYRLALHQSQSGFRDQLNREIDELIETEEYLRIRERWMRHQRRDLSYQEALRYAAPVIIPAVVLLLITWVWTLNRQVAAQTKELAARSAELKGLATHDELTGLANRRLLATIAEKEVTHAKRRGELFSILFMDLDKFKAINDTYGHAIGDTVLVEFARRSTRELREYDIFARYGGEEFVVLLRDSDHEEALAIAERIRVACQAEKFRLDSNHPPVSIGVSIGVATISDGDNTFGELLARADEAMYRAKQDGRNRVRGDVSGSPAP